jgi:hypothetical protein
VYEYKEFSPVQANLLNVTARTQTYWTTDGWVVVAGGLTTTATAALIQHNQFAIFKMSPSGAPVYYGTYGLPMNTNIGVIFNPQEAEPSRMKDSFSSIYYDAVQNIPYRVSLDVEFIKTA